MNAFLKRPSPQRKGLAIMTTAMFVGTSLIAGTPAAFATDALIEPTTTVVEGTALDSGDPGDGAASENTNSGDNTAADSSNHDDSSDAPAAAKTLTPASAPTTFAVSAAPNFVVDSLAMNATAVDAAPGDGNCVTAAGDCTLLAALQETNAQAAGFGDITISFADSLGTAQLTMDTGFAQRMNTETLGTLWAGTFGTAGAYFEVDAKNPVTIDFGNDITLWANDLDVAGVLVTSDDVTIKNSPNNRAGAAAYVVRGENAKLQNLTVSDPGTPVLEVGIGIMTGAKNLNISNYSAESIWHAGIALGNGEKLDGLKIDKYTITNVGGDDSVPVMFGRGSTASNVSVTNSTFKNHGEYGVIYLEDQATSVDGLTVDNNTFDLLVPNGADLWISYTATVKNLVFTNNISKTNQQSIWVRGTATLENAVIKDNVYEGTKGIFNADNYAGTTKNVEISGNKATGIKAGDGVIYQRNMTDGFVVKNNTISETVGNTVMWIEGPIPSAAGFKVKNVEISDNLIENSAGTLIEGIYLSHDVENGVIKGNDFIQTEAWLAANPAYDHNWAIRTFHSKGWNITGNHVDGYGKRGLSEAPFKIETYNKNTVVGNTFGTRTNGTTEAAKSEAGAQWFMWNVGATNNRLQTLRPENAKFDGTKVSFTAAAVNPAVPGNTNQAGPYTLHVYWTAADHAEEYLGEISNVAAGASVSIPTTHSGGFIRVQTVANGSGDVSQYSGVAQISDVSPPAAPAAPVIDKVTETEISGTGLPGAVVIVRDSKGNVVKNATVDAGGNWIITGPVPCGEVLTATQRTDGSPESPVSKPHNTADCPVDLDAPVIKKVTLTEVNGTGAPGAKVTVYTSKGVALGSAVVAEDGTWVYSGKVPCGEVLTATQRVDDPEVEESPLSEPVNTPACVIDVKPENGGHGGNGGHGDKLPNTGGSSVTGIAGIAAAIMALGGTALAYGAARRRKLS